MFKLYYSPGACSLAAHTVLEEIGAPYEAQAVNLRAGEHKEPTYLAINPKGAVPALATEHGVLTENVAILNYLAAKHPEAGLAPLNDVYATAALTSFNGYLGSSVHPAIGKLMFSRPALEGDARTQQQDLTLAKLRVLEDSLYVGPWAMGPRFSVADPYLMVFERWARQGGLLDPDTFPHMNDHLDRVQQRPATQRALAAEGLSPL
ncbi:glutathione S-transferase N-terminal domain-containing protein [Brevundimonas sp.]|uniref:glutathione S-transferase family protein n=1 Tax=Brevundimonas sp. TaxID=1871086 RepID=UPI0025D6F38E|nr:glutathione S-transferase N-terminal domain-containing protein [Brevundimonas sp.]